VPHGHRPARPRRTKTHHTSAPNAPPWAHGGGYRGVSVSLRLQTPRGARARDPDSASHRPLVEKKEGEASLAEAEDEDGVARPRGPADLFKTGELVEGVAVVVEP